MLTNHYYRDASGRLTIELLHVPVKSYRHLSMILAAMFDLVPEGEPVTEQIDFASQKYQRGGQAIELAWYPWAGFAVTALHAASESLVREISVWLLKSDWATDQINDRDRSSPSSWWIGDGRRRSHDNKLCFPLYSNAEWFPLEQLLALLRDRFQARVLSEYHGPEDSNVYDIVVRGIHIVLFYDSGWDFTEFFAQKPEDERAALALANDLLAVTGKRPEIKPPSSA